MGALIEINNTLKISKDRGFPRGLEWESFKKDPETIAQKFIGREFDFWNRDARLYHHDKTRVFLVEEMQDGKWLYWGNAWIMSQTLEADSTSGRYRITKIYTDPHFMEIMTNTESPAGKSFFGGKPSAIVDSRGY